MTKRIQHSVEVDVPVRTAYDQWTQFEAFPRFMRHVEDVRQLDDSHLRWRVNLGGMVREFTAEIVEQVPDRRIAWRSVEGAHHSGSVTFESTDGDHCIVTLQLEYEPEGWLEKVGTIVGIPEFDVERDMARFVDFLEKRRAATGDWRGSIPNQADPGSPETDRGWLRPGATRSPQSSPSRDEPIGGEG